MSGRPEFSHVGYRVLLQTGLDGGFAFAAFEDHERCAAERVCLIRHDVDADPGAAIALARIEAELGIVATYFFMLRSPLYNVFGRANHALVEDVLALGQRIGLHYDPGFTPRAGRTHTEQISIELDVLEGMFGVRPGAVAFHQPSQVPGGMEIEVEGAVKANLLPGYHFVADPNKSEWVLEAFDHFRTGAQPRLQLLVHPVWWLDPDAPPQELWERAILANWERSQEQLLRHEGAYGPPRTLRLERR